MVMKFNPKTNRFENTDTTNQTLEQQRLARFQELLRQGLDVNEARDQANSEIMVTRGPATTTTTTPKSPTTTTPKETGRRPSTGRSGSQENKPPTNPNSPRPRGGGAPTTTVPKSPTTTVPKSPTTTVPKSPTTTVPKSTTTTVPASPSTTVPVTPTTVPTTPATDPLVSTFEEYWEERTGTKLTPAQSDAISAMKSGGSGSGSSGPTAAQKKASAKIQTNAGKKAQAQYNAMAAKFLQDAQAETGKYYAAQQAQANTAIDDATKDYLANLIAPTAYNNVPIAQLTPEQQGLMSNLQAYGGTGELAQGQQQKDAGFNQFMAQLLSNSTRQLQQADTGYFDALRNAGVGGQMAAKQGVAGNTAFLQGQSQANIDAVRRQLIQAGIDALMAGQANAANTLAS